MVWSARPTIQRKPSSSSRARSVVRTQPASASWSARHLEQSHLAGLEHGARRLVDDPQRAPRVGATDAAALGRPEPLMVGQVPAGDASAELGRRVVGEHRHAVLLGECVGGFGAERCRARDDRLEAGEVGGIEIGIEHHAQRGGHEARRLRAVAAHAIDPFVHREPFEQRDATAVHHRLQHTEETAEMHERRVDDDDALAQPQIAGLLSFVVLGSFEHALECLVGQIDSLGRPGRAAREQADRGVGPHLSRRPRGVGTDGEVARSAQLGDGRASTGSRVVSCRSVQRIQVLEIGRFAQDQAQVESRRLRR